MVLVSSILNATWKEYFLGAKKKAPLWACCALSWVSLGSQISWGQGHCPENIGSGCAWAGHWEFATSTGDQGQGNQNFGCLFFMIMDLKGLWINSWVQWALHIYPPAAFLLYSGLIHGEGLPGQGNNLLWPYGINKWIPSTDCRKRVPKTIGINLQCIMDSGTARKATSCWNGPCWDGNSAPFGKKEQF